MNNHLGAAGQETLEQGADALALLAEAGDLQFTPGETYVYSNAGYDMLGSLIEAVSGQAYADFMQERIFDPLGMAHTFSLPNPARLADPNLAHSYVRLGDELEVYDSDPFDNLVGSGSFYTTVEDMARYDQALYTQKLVKQATLAEAFEPVVLNTGIAYRYGFGWSLGTHASQPYVGHDGAWLGFLSNYVRFPQQRLAVIILLNRDYDLPELNELAFEIADLYLKECP
ncbi:MAG: beta-lactamase family protein [Chloroflexi bacterium]|nr:beta-lactamase family protein [Chloroflexota bacterium]